MPEITSTTTPNVPFVPLPPGVDWFDDWRDWNYEFRLIWGADREVASFTDDAHRAHERSVIVAPCVHQLPDGSIDAETSVIVFQGKGADGRVQDVLTLPASRAREFAQAILDAAGELDGWAAR
jgi:hypothetical protein